MPSNDLWTACSRLWLPRVRRPVQEWCDDHLRLSERVAYQAGPWHTAAFAHQRGIFWLWSHPEVEEISLCWGTRLGKTVLIPALIAWASCNDPGPAMVALSSRDSAHIFEREKIYPMLEDCKETADLLPLERWRVFGRVDLRQMVAYMAWSGSATSLGEKSIRYLYMTELDKWAAEESREADPEALALNRVKDWPNRKILKESTPTIEGLSRIDNNLRAADIVLVYHVPCPSCGRFQPLEFQQIKWDKDGEHSRPKLARKTARYECRYCGYRIEDYHRYPMLARGVWAPEDHEVPRDTQALVLWGGAGPQKRVGTRLSSLYSPTLSWGEIAEAFLRAEKTIGGLQDFRNSWLALTFSLAGAVPDWAEARDRLRTTTPRGKVPPWALVLTAGIDCHSPTQRGNYYVVRAWGREGRSQLVEEGVVWTPAQSVRAQIIESVQAVMDREWTAEDGSRSLPVRLGCIDSGGTWTRDVYEACMGYLGRLRPTKGEGGAGLRPPWRVAATQADPATGKPFPAGLRLFILDANHWRGYVCAKTSLAADAPGAWLMHDRPDEMYMRQLCNVYLAPRINTKRQTVEEFRVNDLEIADHYHDAECLAAAAADMLGALALRVVGPRAVVGPEGAGPRPGGYRPAKSGSTFGKTEGWKIGR